MTQIMVGAILKTTNGGTTFINQKNVPSIPDDCVLFQNYPNPFNPITTIKYSLPGNLIEELVNGEMGPGEHRIKFNSGDLSSGVYIYQLQTNSDMLSRKMILLK